MELENLTNKEIVALYTAGINEDGEYTSGNLEYDIMNEVNKRNRELIRIACDKHLKEPETADYYARMAIQEESYEFRNQLYELGRMDAKFGRPVVVELVFGLVNNV